jgi:predicted lipoprotein with Yx(FWY)xxD motif
MKRIQATTLAVLLSGLGLGAQVLAADALTTKDGFTVYTFDKDSGGKSACNGGCATQWPPVAPDAMKSGAESITRDDGSKQAAMGGKPLYRFAGDQKAGDRIGDGMGGVWHAAGGGEPAAQPAYKY